MFGLRVHLRQHLPEHRHIGLDYFQLAFQLSQLIRCQHFYTSSLHRTGNGSSSGNWSTGTQSSCRCPSSASCRWWTLLFHWYTLNRKIFEFLKRKTPMIILCSNIFLILTRILNLPNLQACLLQWEYCRTKKKKLIILKPLM